MSTSQDFYLRNVDNDQFVPLSCRVHETFQWSSVLVLPSFLRPQPPPRLMRPERSSWWTSRTRPLPSELQYEKPENYWIVQLPQGMFKVALGLGTLSGVGFLLVAAMTKLNLIDHMGDGIHRIVDQQRKHFLPLPDYDLGVLGEVKLTVFGAVIDEAYSKLPMAREDLPLEDVLALDRVQKHMPINAGAEARLRKVKLIEGRKLHLRVAAAVADAVGTRAEFIRTRGHDDAFYINQVRDYLENFGAASRADIDGLLLSQLSAVLDDRQKRNKVGNLLGKMRDAGTIRNDGTRAGRDGCSRKCPPKPGIYPRIYERPPQSAERARLSAR